MFLHDLEASVLHQDTKFLHSVKKVSLFPALTLEDISYGNKKLSAEYKNFPLRCTN